MSPVSRHSLRAGIPDELRPDHRAAVAGDEPDLDVRVADLRVLVRHDHVAEECERSAETGRGAVQPADDRLLEVEQGRDDALGVGQDAAEAGRVVDHVLEPDHVAARAEGTAGAGEHDEVALPVVLGVDEDVPQFVVQVVVHGVDRAVVDGDGQDAAVAGQGERLVAVEVHAVSCGELSTSGRQQFSGPELLMYATRRQMSSSPSGSCPPNAIMGVSGTSSAMVRNRSASRSPWTQVQSKR